MARTASIFVVNLFCMIARRSSQELQDPVPEFQGVHNTFFVHTVPLHPLSQNPTGIDTAIIGIISALHGALKVCGFPVWGIPVPVPTTTEMVCPLLDALMKILANDCNGSGNVAHVDRLFSTG